MTALIKLRDLPGVERATQLCRNPRNFDYPQSSYTAEELAGISISFFGIPEWETWWLPPESDGNAELRQGKLSEEDLAEIEESREYEEQFNVTKIPWTEARVFWEALGWDLSDGNENELISAHCFARQIIVVAGDLVEGVRLTIDGTGVWDPEETEAIETVEERLRREADEFMRGRSS
jgi:hypothetical protein